MFISSRLFNHFEDISSKINSKVVNNFTVRVQFPEIDQIEYSGHKDDTNVSRPYEVVKNEQLEQARETLNNLTAR